jgi:hypothetical protein
MGFKKQYFKITVEYSHIPAELIRRASVKGFAGPILERGKVSPG